MQPCTDTDLKTNIISSQECELQDLSNQNCGLQKVLDKFDKKVTKLKMRFLFTKSLRQLIFFY